MKLVILAATLPAYRKDFYESLNYQLSKHDCELIVLHGTGRFNKAIKFDEDPGYRSKPLKNIQFKFLGFHIVWWKGILHQIRKIKPKIVIFHASSGNISVWVIQLFCYLKNIKIGIWSCGYVRQEVTGVKKSFRAKIRYSFFKQASFVFTYGTKYRKELIKKGFDESKIFVAQNTIYVEKILEKNFEKKISNKQNEKVFLFVGALIPQKNLGLAIRAIARLVREKYEIKFNIVGKGETSDELKSIVAEEGMENNVFILGPKYGSELPSYFVNADVFLLPGTGGLAINEAMAYGLPIISTTGDSTIVDLLYEGQNGFFLDDKPGVEDIYDICKEFLSLNESKLKEMGNLSKKIIKEKATLQNMVSVFESVIFMENTNKNKQKNILWGQR